MIIPSRLGDRTVWTPPYRDCLRTDSLRHRGSPRLYMQFFRCQSIKRPGIYRIFARPSSSSNLRKPSRLGSGSASLNGRITECFPPELILRDYQCKRHLVSMKPHRLLFPVRASLSTSEGKKAEISLYYISKSDELPRPWLGRWLESMLASQFFLQ